MSHDSREISIASGQPVRLYEFALGTKRWLVCNSTLDIVHQGKTFNGNGSISDDGIRQTGEKSADTLTITVAPDFELLQQYTIAPPRPVSITIWDMHIGETEGLVQWVGQISDINHRKASVQLVCKALSSDATTGLRLFWSRTCPHILYDNNCAVDKTAFAVQTTLDSVAGLSLSAAAFAGFDDGYFTGGMVSWFTDYGEFESRGINDHMGNTLVISGVASGLMAGVALTAYPGCNKTITTCDEKFSNFINYGGIPGMPTKSPFDGDPVF